MSTQGETSALRDGDLLLAWKERRDQSAFEELTRRHMKAVYGVCLRVLRNGHDAEDAAQAVFLLFMDKTEGLDAGTCLSGWFHESARYVSLRMLQHLAVLRKHEERFSATSRTLSILWISTTLTYPPPPSDVDIPGFDRLPAHESRARCPCHYGRDFYSLRLDFYLARSAAGPQEVWFDEFRVGATYADVTPAPFVQKGTVFMFR